LDALGYLYPLHSHIEVAGLCGSAGEFKRGGLVPTDTTG
jgi:hypothetical protein